MPPMRGSRGFTIIELLMTVALLAVLMGLALPSYQEVVKNNCMTTSANNLVSMLQYSRSEAIKRRTNVSITPIGGDWGEGLQVRAGAELLREVNLGCAATEVTEEDAQTAVTYRATGFVTDPASFEICDDRESETGRQITISSTGRPSMDSSFSCI